MLIPSSWTVERLIRHLVHLVSIMASMSPWAPILGTTICDFVVKKQIASLTIGSSSLLSLLSLWQPVGLLKPEFPLLGQRWEEPQWLAESLPLSAGLRGVLFALGPTGVQAWGTGTGARLTDARWPCWPHLKHLPLGSAFAPLTAFLWFGNPRFT